MHQRKDIDKSLPSMGLFRVYLAPNWSGTQSKPELPDRAGASSNTQIKISVVRKGNRKVRDTRMPMT